MAGVNEIVAVLFSNSPTTVFETVINGSEMTPPVISYSDFGTKAVVLSDNLFCPELVASSHS